MNKTIIIINGKGGCGKDTLCDIAAKKYKTMNVSSITPAKEMAKIIGWDGGKTAEDRKFLSDLKQLITQYNDGANEYILKEAQNFASSDCEIMFVHIREPEMINHFKETVAHRVPGLKVRTLLVERDSQKYLVYGNSSDDEVDNYPYECIYHNDTEPEKIEECFLPFLDIIIKH